MGHSRRVPYSAAYSGKDEAVRAAIEFAERDGQTGREAEVLVQGRDRLFRPAWTYGNDPYPIESEAVAEPEQKPSGRALKRAAR